MAGTTAFCSQELSAVDHQQAQVEDPWADKLVLSLDGGGIRGLSSLFILEKLAELIASKDEGRAQHDRLVKETLKKSPFALLSHYFDVIWGTSAGGLTALMLGRLRMDVQDAISTYDNFGEEVFGRPYRLPYKGTRFSASKLEKLLKDVVRSHCKDHAIGDCDGEDELPQPDNVQGDLIKTQTAVITARQNGKVVEYPYALRSYDHERKGRPRYIVEHGPADRVQIWFAARATAAAPFIFSAPTRDEKLEDPLSGKTIHSKWRYRDGAIGCNNPVNVALDEALQMSPNHRVAMVLSIGTGQTSSDGLFYRLFPITFLAKNVVVGVDHDHIRMEKYARENNVPYYRFQVQKGLEKIGIGDWRKRRLWLKRVRTAFRQSFKRPRIIMMRGDNNSTCSIITGEEASISLNSKSTPCRQSLESSSNRDMSIINREKYQYQTRDTIEHATHEYIAGFYENEDVTVLKKIEEVAEFVVKAAKQRRERDPARWRKFTENSSPWFRSS